MNRRAFLGYTPMIAAAVTAPVATLAVTHNMDAQAIALNDETIRKPFRNGDPISIGPFNAKFAAIADELRRIREGT